MKGLKTVYTCSECGNESPKWLGKCPKCGAWNSFVEDVVEKEPEVKAVRRVSLVSSGDSEAEPFSELSLPEYIRTGTGVSELDRVLGGGIVLGSVVLLSGEPGIGKSTLLLQICDSLADGKKILYVSGEESTGQIRLRADRLKVKGENLFLLTETNVSSILKQIEKVGPDILIVDSVQTVYSDTVASAPGSVSQVKECAMTFIAEAKKSGTSVILVGHVNKEGGIAGPKVLEHIVDAVLCFEGDRKQNYRIIRATKNRFGSTNEIGVFEMTDTGLSEVVNPSEMLLSDRPDDVSGNVAVCAMEGTRPILAEVQALVSPTSFPAPRRTADGIDYNRMCLILAVLEKRIGMRFSANDVYLNVIGGLSLDEPASDLAVACAMISSFTNTVLPNDLIALGELGLSGECRAVPELDLRLKEAARLGFTEAWVPARSASALKKEYGMKIVSIRNVFDVLRAMKKYRKDTPETDV